VGNITALFVALGNIVYLLTKHTQMAVADAPSWKGRFELPQVAKLEILFWLRNLGNLRRLPLAPDRIGHATVIYTDASAHSCAGFIQNFQGTELVQSFSNLDKLRSSTWRELKAVESFLTVHQKALVDKQILYCCILTIQRCRSF
jgi:hypothetical protein